MQTQQDTLIQVECYSGYKANERPIAVIWEGRRLMIVEILDRWYEGGMQPDKPSIDYYKVQTEDGQVLILRYNKLFDTWTAASPFENSTFSRTEGKP